MTADGIGESLLEAERMAGRIDGFDWNQTPLGPKTHWPDALSQLVDLILASPQPMCLLWGAEALQLYNDAHARLLGELHPRALGLPAREGWGGNWPKLAEAWSDGLTGNARQLKSIRLEPAVQAGGREGWFDACFSPVRQGNDIAGVLLHLTDHTERILNETRLTEAALRYKLSADNHRLSEQRLQLALEASDLLGIWDWDLREDHYKKVPDFFTLAPLDVPGAPAGLSLQSFLEHIAPCDRERILGAIEYCIQHNGAFAERYRINSEDGSVRWAFARGRCHYDDQGRPVRFPGAIMDITRQLASEEALRQSEGELRELNETLESRIQERTSALAEVYERLLAEMSKREQAQEALRQAQKMEAVGQLTGGIAHDFNNMLTGIIGGLDLIQHYIKSGRHAETERFIEAAITSANRAAALTHRLLAFSRRQPLDLKRVELNELIESMQELFSRTLGPHIHVLTELQEDAWAVVSDENQLESALLNLVINARDAMPEGGTLRITSRNLRLAGNGEVGDLPAGQYVVLAVSDSGCGMSPRTLASAFEPFFTTKPIGQGTGLGLSMIYGFVRQSGGHVQLLSELGVGTEVSLYLPVHAGEIEPVEGGAQPSAPQLAPQDEQILVVEDDAAVRMLVVEVLGDLGYRVLEATDGSGAMALIESSTRIDLLISDVGLPGMNGRQLADMARESRPDLRILFMTGYAAQAASSGFLAPGMELISKPFSIDTLIRHVQQTLAD